MSVRKVAGVVANIVVFQYVHNGKRINGGKFRSSLYRIDVTNNRKEEFVMMDYDLFCVFQL